MTHVFVSPHPDDIALSCGGLVAGLAGSGETVVIVTIFCGPGSNPSLTDYQCDALGFGSGAAALGAAPSPEAAMAERRDEDNRYARSVGARIIFLNLPDAVFRGYEGEAQLMGTPRPDDPAPIDALARELDALKPRHVYVPLGVGSHVDHQLTRAAGIALLGGPRDQPSRAVAVGPGLLERLVFYEDFPYAQLPAHALATMPHDVSLAPEYRELARLLGRKVDGIRVYANQVDSLFGSDAAMADAVLSGAIRVGQLGGIGPAERYWRAIGS